MGQKDYPDRSGINRFGEQNIKPDYIEGKDGMRRSRIGNLEHSRPWSQDSRSESSSEKHHYGKGPRNFSRSDDFLKEEVCEAFLHNPDLDPSDIDVSVDQGVVTLKGFIRHRQDKYLAEELALDVSGVKDVMNLLSRGKFDEGDEPKGLIKGLR